MNRRGFLGGLLTALAAPAIIRTPGLLMPVRAPLPLSGFLIMEPHKWEIHWGALVRVEGPRGEPLILSVRDGRPMPKFEIAGIPAA